MNAQIFKQQLLNKLYEPYLNCKECPLGSLGRTHIVFGEGNPDAQLMLVGEGPGRDEDIQGRPFVGRSGKLLTKILLSLGVSRDTIFITNVVKCRPPANRAPTPQESNTCTNLFLYKQIKIIRPKVICTLGASAIQTFFPPHTKIGTVRGRLFQQEGHIIAPTYHPAYILRNPQKSDILINDLKIALKAAGLNFNK